MTHSAQAIGVIFDMDGVLVDSYAAHLESWQRLAGELGLSITDAQFDATFGRTSREIIRELFGITDPRVVAAQDDRKEAIYRRIIRGNVPLMSGTTCLLQTLFGEGCRIAVGSSGPPENVALVCESAGLERYLHAKVTGDDVTHGKPDPEVFLLSAERLGLPPSRCVVVEDAPTGVEAAHRAGMRCIALAGTYGVDALARADCIVHSLDQIRPGLIRDLVG